MIDHVYQEQAIGITLGYGTMLDNTPARATAERCGYVLNNLSYWGCVSGEPYSTLPDDVRARLEYRDRDDTT